MKRLGFKVILCIVTVFLLLNCAEDTSNDVAVVTADAQRINHRLKEIRGTIERLKIKAIDVLHHVEKYQDGLYDSKRYAFFKDTVFYTPENDGFCEVWASGIVPVDEVLFSKIKALENLCTDMDRIYHENNIFSAVYLNTKSSVVVAFPYASTNTYLKPELDTRQAWVTYWAADADHNPDRKTLWVGPYLDALGYGYMVSIITPVYRGDRMEAAIGFDITCESLRDLFLADTRRNLMLINEKGYLTAANAGCSKLIGIEGPGSHDYLEKASENRPAPEKFNLHINSNRIIRELAAKVAATTAPFDLVLGGRPYKVIHAGIEDAGWYLVELKGS
ncbi:MAG: hypothetical protein HKM93_02555 [Desulfobacteraceae bacterium]|nr:hypothetical protein [Desulfobacteraceae bacterium]